MRAGQRNQPIASKALDALVTFLLSVAGVLAVFLALVPLLSACASQPPAAPESAAPEPAAPEPAALEPEGEEASPYIVQGIDLASVIAAVEENGATVTHELKIIRAVGARLTAAQRAALAEHPDVTRIYEDREVGID